MMHLGNFGKRGMLAAAMALAVVLLANGTLMAAQWEPFEIRDKNGNIPGDANYNSDGDAPNPVEKPSGRGVTVTIDQSSEKAGYGTSHFDGGSLSQIPSVDWTRLDSGDKYPYVNVWVNDGTNYAVFAPETSSAPFVSQVKGLDFQSLQIRVYETDYNNMDWIETGANRASNGRLLDGSGNPITIGELSHLDVGAPTDFSSPDIGTGAPRNDTGFNLIFGDTQSNFDQPVPYEIDNVAVPTPSAIAGGLALLGGLGLSRRRRRKA